jgi:hypothetical protein
MEIVLNKCFGGFSISIACAEYMAKKGSKIAKAELSEYKKKKIKGKDKLFSDTWFGYGIVQIGKKHIDGYSRTDPLLVEAVKKLKERANGSCARLKVVEIPDDVKYYIDDYDGMESVDEQHRSWG